MIFKSAIFVVILLLIAVLAVRGYRSAVKRFEADRAEVEGERLSVSTPVPDAQRGAIRKP